MLRSMTIAQALAEEVPESEILLMPRSSVVIDIDAAAALAELDLLSQAAERSLELRQLLLDLGDLGAHFRFVHVEVGAAKPATQLRYRFELSDRLAELALAVRAGDFDAL